MATPMRDQIVLLTGATHGIGRETARALARQGACLVLGCRNLEQAEALCSSLQRESGNPQISSLRIDLADLASVRQFAQAFRERYSQLHVLINNAGTFSMQREETKDGFERTLGTNYVGPFLLTSCLLPVLQATPGARIINVSSDAYRYGKLDLNDLPLKRHYEGFPAYARSKLALQLWTQELDERLRPYGVTVNSLHPGHVATNIWQLWPRPTWYQTGLIKLMGMFMSSAEAGAETSIYLATAPEVAGVSGAYFIKKRAQKLVGPARNLALQQELWRVSEQLTGCGG